MAIVAYITVFSILVLKTNHPNKVVNIILLVPKDTAFILSKSRVDRYKCWWDNFVISKMQTDKRTDSFLALFTVVEDSLIGVMKQKDKGV